MSGIPTPQYIAPGIDPTEHEFEPPRSSPGCWRIVAVGLAILAALAACGGFGAGASLASQRKPTLAPSETPTATVTPTGTIPTPTRTPIPSRTPIASRTPSPTVEVFSAETGFKPTASTTPTPTACVGYHRVRSGQYASGIASLWRVSLASLISANNLKNPSLLYTGQILVIPGRCSPPTNTPAPINTPTNTPALDEVTT